MVRKSVKNSEKAVKSDDLEPVQDKPISSPIFVTGCARSGTSLTMAILGNAGINLGAINKLNEISALRDGVIKPYLQQIGADPRGQYPIPEIGAKVVDNLFSERVKAGMGDAQAAKIIKGVLIHDSFIEAFPNSKWIIVMRDRLKIADSCMRTVFMNAYHTTYEWLLWADEYHKRCELLKEKAQTMTVYPDELKDGNTESYEAALEWLGYSSNHDDIMAVFKPEKWH